MKNRSRQALVVFITLVAIAVGAMIAPSTSDASQAFSNRSVRGTWGFSASGTIVPPALPSATPAVAVGIIKFDGNGECTFTDQINIGGNAIPSTGFRTSSSCDYSVSSDGTGTIGVSFPGDPGPTPLTFVIVDEGKELHFIRTDAGVANGVAKRQR